ncbi:MAG TPA: twin-arginine translocase TatA/TatE family subunit [Acidimicrobiales bacterium]|nr:twin-arginine translocase TatA/TatE family subunit [Acidimicrobiales bacterium]
MLAFINDTGMLVVVLAVVLLFGATRLPKLARSLGEAGREFRKAHDEANVEAPVTPHVTVTQPIGTSATLNGDAPITVSRSQLDALVAAKAAGEATASRER